MAAARDVIVLFISDMDIRRMVAVRFTDPLSVWFLLPLDSTGRSAMCSFVSPCN